MKESHQIKSHSRLTISFTVSAARGEPSRAVQRPEDFMDAEDLGDFGIAPQGLKTSAQFSKVKPEEVRKRKREELSEATAIPGEPVELDELFRPVTETVGVNLLKGMGWRQGQGIGPRLSSKQKARQAEANKRMFGCPLPASQQDKTESDEDDEGVDPKYRAFLFAPDDVPQFLANPKNNLFGIGYSGLEKPAMFGGSGAGHINLFEDPSQRARPTGPQPGSLAMRGKKSGRAIKFTGQAFGVGAYEEDDDDIYARDDINRYDFELDDAGAGRGQREKRRSRWGDPKIGLEAVTECIEGFQISKSGSTIKKKLFAAPELPKGFIPRAGARKSRFDADSREELKTTNPTPSQRQRALALPKDGDAAATKKKEPTQSDEQIRKLLASASSTPSGELGSFQPFARDAEKQKRYEKYVVCARNGRADALPLLQPKTMTEWERERERVEFERAAVLFR